MKHYFKLTANGNQVIYGRIELWNGIDYPENYQNLSTEDKEAWKPTRIDALKFANTKTLKLNHFTKYGYETNLQDAFNSVINALLSEWNLKVNRYQFQTVIDENHQKAFDEIFDNEIKATKELKEAFANYQYE